MATKPNPFAKGKAPAKGAKPSGNPFAKKPMGPACKKCGPGKKCTC
jgi:hypothetical protein